MCNTNGMILEACRCWDVAKTESIPYHAPQSAPAGTRVPRRKGGYYVSFPDGDAGGLSAP